MSKRIVIKIGAGTIETGYVAAVQIGNEGVTAQAEVQARLSAAPDLPGLYQRWQDSYRQLGLSYRLAAIASPTNVSYASEMERCRSLSNQLRLRVSRWLSGKDFQPIREKILEQLSPQDAARILLQTQDPLLQRLPWYELNFFQRYRNAEVGVCLPCYQQVSYQGSRSRQVKVLAVIGEATGLDTRMDRELLSRLPNADVKVLNAPSRERFTCELWNRSGWDILYFAGHSQSHLACGFEGENARGEIQLNETDSLTMPQLRHALSKAIDRGLNTAIFNSCDGLGLASDLADLHIPQVLVMREPVPDQVAHAFLRGFLESFSAGAAFYVAVREAREKLEALESRFPCATWLPVIVQNLAETPPTWKSLCDGESYAGQSVGVSGRSVSVAVTADVVDTADGYGDQPANRTRHGNVVASWIALKRGWKVAIAAGVGCAALVWVGRSLGALESFELMAYDYFLRSRPTEPIDERLLIIRNTDADIEARPNTTGTRTLSDDTLSELLTQLDQLNPAIVGLDIYLRGQTPSQALSDQLKAADNLVAICKDADYTSETSAIAPPEELRNAGWNSGRIGASDFVEDGDQQMLRRHLLAFAPSADSSCQVGRTFSEVVASRYLETVYDVPQAEKNAIVSAQQPFIRESSFGGYQGVDKRGTQMMLNYRISKTPSETNCGPVEETPADCITVSRFLEMSPEDLKRQVDHKIVLIGTTANGYGDLWRTPYSRENSEVPGVFLQAQMISQQVSAVVEGRSLLKSWAQWQEGGWILAWALLGGCLGLGAGGYRYWLRLLLAEGTLVVLCWLLLVNGRTWVPWVPGVIALPAAATVAQTVSKATFKATTSADDLKTAK